jgi:hypothetical protein
LKGITFGALARLTVALFFVGAAQRFFARTLPALLAADFRRRFFCRLAAGLPRQRLGSLL